MAWWWLFATFASAGAPLEVKVTDPRVTEVKLVCGAEVLTADVRAGVASFANAPERCTVVMTRTGGAISGPGTWTCTLDNCSQNDVHHAPIANAANRVNIVVTTPMPPGTQLEVACPGGHRDRKALVENTAVFDGVPSEDCTLLFKGSVPAKYQPLKFGTYYCGLTGATAVCTLK